MHSVLAVAVLQAECKVNPWPCVPCSSQTHPQTTAGQQEMHLTLPSSGGDGGCPELRFGGANAGATGTLRDL